MRAFIEQTLLVSLSYMTALLISPQHSIATMLLVYSLTLSMRLIPFLLIRYMTLAALITYCLFNPQAAIYVPVVIYYCWQYFYPIGGLSGILLLFHWQPVTFIIALLATYLALRTHHDLLFLAKSTQTRNRLELDKVYLRQQQLQFEKEQLRHIELATLEERNRIAHRLHDSIGHLISSSILQLEALQIISQETVVQERLALLSELMQDGMNDIRHNLHNLYDESFDLHAKIIQVCQPLEERDLHLTYAIDSALSLSLKVDILSIVQELVANYQKHSNATSVKLAVIEQPNFWSISYRDNGTFTQTDFSGIGLLSMSDTAKKYHGNLTLHTQDGFGVHIVLMKGD
ncbi:histidine kinase [Aerococcaceae bacterium NML160702]|nr:histidine kinase [Aerococcaceae bacterium NML160702]